MKTVRFETVRELALALLDGRRFKVGEAEIYFSDENGFSDDLSYAMQFAGGGFYELPTKRHHAELIKAWADDGSLKLQWFMSYGNNEDLWRDSPTSGDFYEGNSLRLVGNGGEVIMVSESKK